MKMTKDNMLNHMQNMLKEVEIKDRHVSMLKNEGHITIPEYLEIGIYSTTQDKYLKMQDLLHRTYLAYDSKATFIKERYNTLLPIFNEYNEKVSTLLHGYVIEGREY